MICCDNCNEWYHIACINMDSKIARTLARDDVKFFCQKCQGKPYEPKAYVPRVYSIFRHSKYHCLEPKRVSRRKRRGPSSSSSDDSSSDSDSDSSSSSSEDDHKLPTEAFEVEKRKRGRPRKYDSPNVAKVKKSDEVSKYIVC
jgi:hypothetical protein